MVHTEALASKLQPLSDRQRPVHDQQLPQPVPDTVQFPVLPRIIKEWNELPPEATAVDTFNNNNVHLSFAHRRPGRSRDTH